MGEWAGYFQHSECVASLHTPLEEGKPEKHSSSVKRGKEEEGDWGRERESSYLWLVTAVANIRWIRGLRTGLRIQFVSQHIPTFLHGHLDRVLKLVWKSSFKISQRHLDSRSFCYCNRMWWAYWLSCWRYPYTYHLQINWNVNFFYFSIGLLAALVYTVRFPQQKSAPSRVELVSSPLDLTQPIAGPTDQSDLDDWSKSGSTFCQPLYTRPTRILPGRQWGVAPPQQKSLHGSNMTHLSTWHPIIPPGQQ